MDSTFGAVLFFGTLLAGAAFVFSLMIKSRKYDTPEEFLAHIKKLSLALFVPIAVVVLILTYNHMDMNRTLTSADGRYSAEPGSWELYLDDEPLDLEHLLLYWFIGDFYLEGNLDDRTTVRLDIELANARDVWAGNQFTMEDLKSEDPLSLDIGYVPKGQYSDRTNIDKPNELFMIHDFRLDCEHVSEASGLKLSSYYAYSIYLEFEDDEGDTHLVEGFFVLLDF